MTEQSLLRDITKQMQHRYRVVLLDPAGQCGFALPILKQNRVTVLQTDSSISEKWQPEKEELLLRQKAEIEQKEKQVMFYFTWPQATSFYSE